jgi:pyruvate,water dikinase
MQGLVTELIAAGMLKGRQALGRPIANLLRRRINTYSYFTQVPLRLPPEEAAAHLQRFSQQLDDILSRFDAYWQAHLSEIKQHLAFWDAYALPSATMPVLLAHLDETVTRFVRLYEIHALLGTPMLFSQSLFEEFYRELFSEQSALEAYRLLQGLSNLTVETGHALWRLSRKALAMPSVMQALAHDTTIEVLSALAQTDEGRAFHAGLREYLSAYGQRGDDFGLDYPSWIEDPTPVIERLRAFVKPDARDPIADMERLAAEREQAIATTRTKLQGYPQAVRARFEMLLKAAHVGVIVSEDHNFYLDMCSRYYLRRVFLEFGRRFALANVIAQATDVLYLTLEEMRETAARPSTSLHSAQDAPLHQTVAARKAEMARWGTITPPPQLGTRPPPSTVADDLFARTTGKFFGTPLPPSTEPNVWRGHAGSAGIARGRAKVVRTLAEASKLQNGDILVSETTAPPWTPLFATVSAIVTDTGGILSHSAVVAREYGIPAVVGTGRATKMIQDGMMLEVDGNAGVVRVVNED